MFFFFFLTRSISSALREGSTGTVQQESWLVRASLASEHKTGHHQLHHIFLSPQILNCAPVRHGAAKMADVARAFRWFAL